MGVRLQKVVEKMDLRNLTPELDVSNRTVNTPDVNRPALQLAGYFAHFESERLQIIGNVEFNYLKTLEEVQKENIYQSILSYSIPAFIFCRNHIPDDRFLELAREKKIPVYITDKATSSFSAELIRWLKVQLAPCISIHGVLVDVNGIGVLIRGESGIGKSEAALELVKRGHRLVADDVVEIRKVSDETLVGTAPEVTRHFIELRGIGIIDVKALFGVQSVKETHNIDMVIRLEEWDKQKEYDRLGINEEYEERDEYLGNKVVCYRIPVRPGRNTAIIVECAAMNHRQKQMGYNAVEELYRRVQENLCRK